MNSIFTTSFTQAKTGNPVPFLGVDVTARLSPSHAVTTLVQKYKNVEERAIEAVYTFPLPYGAALLSLTARIGKDKLKAKVVEAEKASKTYEDALERGDSAMMMEQAAPGLYTLSLGNLLPGEEAKITAVYAEANRWENGLLRWRLPLTVAPKYGKSPLKPHQEPETDVDQRHDATLTMILDQDLIAADVSSNSHILDVAKTKKQLTARIRTGDFAMDRDVVVDVDLKSVVSTAITAGKGKEIAVLATFIPTADLTLRKPRNLKIVLDCSGSMGGVSIQSARSACETILHHLDPKDSFNLIRFGSSHEMMFPCQVKATRDNIKLAEDCVRLIDANMGGTEMRSAMDAAYHSKALDQEDGDVILITDGQTHATETIIAGAKHYRQRIFTVGVGSSVEETVLRKLATATGGAAEFVVPGEGVRAAIGRQFRRVRSAAVQNVEVAWPGKPVSVSKAPEGLFAGDAIQLVAIYDKAPAGKLRISFQGKRGEAIAEEFNLKSARDAGKTADGALCFRLATAELLQEITDTKKRLAWALKYELVSTETSLVVVRENATSKRPEELPALRKVAQMAPVGMAMLAGGSPMMRSRFLNIVASAAPMYAAGAQGLFGASLGGQGNAERFSLGAPSIDSSAFADSAGFSDPSDYAAAPSPSGWSKGSRGKANTTNDKGLAEKIETAILQGKTPETIADLAGLRVDVTIIKALEEIAKHHPEAEVVKTFIAWALQGGTSMSSKLLAARYAQGVNLTLKTKIEARCNV